MKVVIDPETGELYEALPGDLAGGEPYDYADYRRATMASSRQHRDAIAAAEQAGRDLARAEAEYRKQLALTIPGMKDQYGATVAEAMAKGQGVVVEALEARNAAAAIDRAAMERVRLCRDDRAGLLTMGAWSRAASTEGWGTT